MNFVSVLINKGAHVNPIPKHCEAHVDMRIDKTRQHSFAFEVNNFSFGSLVYERIDHFAYEYDLTVFDGHGFDFLLLLVHGVDLAVAENIVRMLVQEVEQNVLGDVFYSMLCELRQFLG